MGPQPGTWPATQPCALETGKDTSIRAACHHQTQQAMTAIESLWALYSDGRLNLYGRFIQMADDLRRWWVHILTDHLVFSLQARLFIAGNKQGTVKGFEIQGGLGERSCNIPVLGG